MISVCLYSESYGGRSARCSGNHTGRREQNGGLWVIGVGFLTTGMGSVLAIPDRTYANPVEVCFAPHSGRSGIVGKCPKADIGGSHTNGRVGVEYGL